MDRHLKRNFKKKNDDPVIIFEFLRFQVSTRFHENGTEFLKIFTLEGVFKKLRFSLISCIFIGYV